MCNVESTKHVGVQQFSLKVTFVVWETFSSAVLMHVYHEL